MDHFAGLEAAGQKTKIFNFVLRGRGCLGLLQKINFLMLLVLLLVVVMSFRLELILQIRYLFLERLCLVILTLFFMESDLNFVLVSCKNYLEFVLIILLLRVNLLAVNFVIQ